MGNKIRKRILFIQRFIEALESPNIETFVIDEVGWGRPLRNYGYSRIGEPLILKYAKKFNNITCTCCISQYKVEALKFLSEGGTTNEYFYKYFDILVEKLKDKYPNK